MKVKKRKVHLLTIFFCTADFLVILFFLVVYGPFGFKDWWITTAMGTGNHKYFAKVLYSEQTINRVMANNKVIETDSNTDASEIVFDNTKKDTYDSIYDEQILKRDEGNDLYKLVEIKEKNYSGYMLVIYDSKRVSLATSRFAGSGGQLLSNISKDHDAIGAINASGFTKSEGAIIPLGTVIQNGKVVSIGAHNPFGGGLIGFNKDGVLMLTSGSAENAIRNGMVDAVTWGPFLIVNGKPTEVVGNGGWGFANRTAIAQRKDGIVLFVVIDGRGANGSDGISIKDLITLLERYGAYNAANLDGGGSSAMTINHELINDPKGFGYAGERFLPNAWILK